ncbi:MAG TPA: serine protease, partial [Candidatus Sulfotelmatobacter sp.]|nr:serine protease [Candidatus Sulfotelmatobacter sp.]
AQAPEVPVYRQGKHETLYENTVRTAAKELYANGTVVKLSVVKDQLKRPSCQLDLPKINTTKLTTREICTVARGSHLRVGWLYLCNKCDDWHVNLAGGYVLTTNGAVATCYHVVQPSREVKEGCLIAADEVGKVFAITEVLAANRYSDAAIIRVVGEQFKPLPLNTNVYPGDLAYCYSDPLNTRGYFSDGIVNRFYQFPGRRPVSAPESAAYAPTRLNVGTDWAPGSSGSAVLDDCGNVIGHVSTIAAVGEEDTSDDGTTHTTGPTMIVFHEAVSARDVLRLIRR